MSENTNNVIEVTVNDGANARSRVDANKVQLVPGRMYTAHNKDGAPDGVVRMNIMKRGQMHGLIEIQLYSGCSADFLAVDSVATISSSEVVVVPKGVGINNK